MVEGWQPKKKEIEEKMLQKICKKAGFWAISLWGRGARRAHGAWWRGWQVCASWKKAGVRIPVLTLSERYWELMWRERVLLARFAELGEVGACGRWAHALQSQEAWCDSWFCSALAAWAWTGDLTSLGFINQTWAIIAPPAEGCGEQWMRE